MLLASVAHTRRPGDISGQLFIVHPHSLLMMMHLFSLSLTMLTTTSSLSMAHGTFHSMGSIKCVTPRPERDDSVIITRLQKNLGPAAIGRFGYVPHHQYTDDPKKGLALIDHDDMGHDVD